MKLQTLFADATASARPLFVIASIIASQVLMTETASSATWTLNGSLDDTVSHITDPCCSGTAQSFSLPNSGTFNQVGTATGSVGVNGITGLATVSASGSGTVNASASAELNYDLFVMGPDPTAVVPVGGFAVITTSVGGTGTASASITVNGTPIENGSNGTGFNGEMQLHLMPGTYLVVLQANAAGFGDGSSGSATADPHFFIDTSFDATFDPTGYSVSVDPDVGNGFPPGFGPTETPLPATLPLFATGLGGLGLLGWRRKRKAQAI